MQIHHDAEASQFVAEVEEGEAYLAYEEVAPGVWDLQHTYVSPAERGEGVGEALVRHALERARGGGVRVIPTCPFVARWLEDHPEYADRVTSHQDVALGD